ncbi:MAG: hypothetical protein H7235_11870 [Bdellovibrionaceae bacterium]|nr:hypothetical protein [Pseudobdellovibrionaceae bacterium]
MSRVITSAQYEHLKKKAKRLSKAVPDFTLSHCLELIAKIEDFPNWNAVTNSVRDAVKEEKNNSGISQFKKMFYLGDAEVQEGADSGKAVYLENYSMRHLLYIGQTGSGKTAAASSSVLKYLETYTDTELYVASGSQNEAWDAAAKKYSTESLAVPGPSNDSGDYDRLITKVWSKYKERVELFTSHKVEWMKPYEDKNGKALPTIFLVLDHAVRHPQRRTPSIIFEENLVGGSAGLRGGH